MSCDYKVNGKEYSMMSATNEKILNRLVNNEVYCNLTVELNYIVDKILTTGQDDNAPFSVEDYDNAMEEAAEKICDECGEVGDFEDYDPMTADETDFHGEDWDPEEPVYTCPVCGHEYDTLQEARECCQYNDAKRCKHCGKIYSEYDVGYMRDSIPEVVEWYVVSDWLGTKLRYYGEVVIDIWEKSYWGRQSTGQSIICDNVIEQIAYDLEILEGQTHSWEGRIA